MGKGCPPPHLTRESVGERRKLPQRSSGTDRLRVNKRSNKVRLPGTGYLRCMLS